MNEFTDMAIGDVRKERERQRVLWGDAHDDKHEDGSLSVAAICYVEGEPIFVQRRGSRHISFEDPWPWDGGNPRRRINDYRRSLVKAAALLVAELERLDRAAFKARSSPRAPNRGLD